MRDENSRKQQWYLIDTQGTFCKTWDIIKIVMLSYTFYVSPFVIVFPDVYQMCKDDHGNKLEECYFKTNLQKNMYRIELIIDIFMLLDIVMSFFKQTQTERELEVIAKHYLKGFFAFDFIGTVPELIMKEQAEYYFLKLARLIHIQKVTVMLDLILRIILKRYSKNR